MEEKEKFNLTDEDLEMLERACCLNMVTGFEREFIDNFRMRYMIYGKAVVITSEQRKVLRELNEKYIKSRFPKFRVER